MPSTRSSLRPADVIVGDVRIEGSQTEGGGVAHAAVNTAGAIRVEGGVDFINAAATDTLDLSAGQRIEVITPDGSIRMTGSNGALSGILSLRSKNIVAADSALAAPSCAADPNFTGHAEALATNTGPVNPAGDLQAAESGC